MSIREKIWYDFIHTKFGDEYLVLYICRQKDFRKWSKIVTILLSAGGIFSAFKDFKIPTIITLSCIGFVQLFSLIEVYIIHTEKSIDEIGTLRIMYVERSNKLEELLHSLDNGVVSETEAAEKFFNLRKEANDIEAFDNKVNIKKSQKLMNKANSATLNYIKCYYEQVN